MSWLLKIQVLHQKSTKWVNHFIEERQQIIGRDLKRSGCGWERKNCQTFRQSDELVVPRCRFPVSI